MSKKHAYAVVTALALLAAGCASNSNSGSGGASGGATKHWKITLIAGTTADNFYVTMNCGAQAEAKKLGVTYEFTGPSHFDAPTQIPIVNSVTGKHPDAVLIAPTDVDALVQPMKQMQAAGIKVVEVDTHVSDPSISVSKIASDNEKGGQLAADTLASLIGGSGTVMVVNVNPGISTTDARDKGFKAQMAAKYPGIKVLTTQFDNDDQAKAAQILTSTYAAHPDLKGVFAANTISAEGVATGIRNAKATGKIKTVGFDAEPQSVQDLTNDVVQALIAQQPALIGSVGVEQAVNALEGKPVQAQVGTDLVPITKASMGGMSNFFYKSSC
ncbi:MAG TPA: ABC transporter substrate-binding protein [Rugosimonospora sp.]|nr:ABC transporter substrate-binding protein [Rugosimonospora sp.]